MSRSVTVAVPSASRLARTILTIVLVVAVAAIGVRLGIALVSPGPAAEFAKPGQLQEIVTTTNTFVGQIVHDDGTYLRLRGPAVVRDVSTEGETQILVQLLGPDPYNLDGEILVARSEVVMIGNVTSGSGLETAYRQATGELPRPTPGPTAAPSAAP